MVDQVNNLAEIFLCRRQGDDNPLCRHHKAQLPKRPFVPKTVIAE